MPVIDFSLNVDIRNRQTEFNETVTSGDTVIFRITVTDDGQPVNLETVRDVFLVHKRTHKKAILTPPESKEGNSAVFELGTAEIEFPGDVEVTLQLIDEAGRVTTNNFSYNVRKDPTAQGIQTTEKGSSYIEAVLIDGPKNAAAALEAAQRADAAAIDAEETAAAAKLEVAKTIQATEAGNLAAGKANKAAQDALRIAQDEATAARNIANAAALEAVSIAEAAANDARSIARNAADGATQTAGAAAQQAVSIAEAAADEARTLANSAAGAANNAAGSARTAATTATSAANRADKAAVDAEETASTAAAAARKIATDAATNADNKAATAEQSATKADNSAIVATEAAGIAGTAAERADAAADAVEPILGEYELITQSDTKGKDFGSLDARFEELERDGYFPVKNMLKNSAGDNLDQWLVYSNGVTVVSGKFRVDMSVSSIPLSQAIGISKDSLYYIALNIEYVKGDNGRLYLDLRNGSSRISESFHRLGSSEGRESVVLTAKDNGDKVQFFRADTNTSNVYDISKIIVVDLTETFGAGSEPTAAEMDGILSLYPDSWFDGTVNLAENKRLLPYLLNRLRGKANAKQEDWITPTLLNGYTGGIQYRKNQLGEIEFRGSISGGVAGLTMFELPVGYRPITTFYSVVAATSNASVILLVGNTGVVRSNNNHTSVYFWDVRFST